MPARHQLDRIGDQLAADERGLHAFGAGGDAIVDGHGVHFDGVATCLAYALHHLLRKVTMIEVARHGAYPAVRDTDLWFFQIVVSKARRFHHRARNGAIGPVEQRAALVSWIGAHAQPPIGYCRMKRRISASVFAGASSGMK